MASDATACALPGEGTRSNTGFFEKLNSAWHEKALWLYTAVVLAHWAEHLTQAIQIYVLGWAVPDSRGILGQYFPWMVKSEALHYGYAIVMLVGLWGLRTGFVGRSYKWWMISFWIQFWHHIEHALLQGQAIFGGNLFDRPVPTSIVQLWVPRVELHLFYNTVVFIPMLLAMYWHMFPPAGETVHASCSCEWKPRKRAAQAAG